MKLLLVLSILINISLIMFCGQCKNHQKEYTLIDFIDERKRVENLEKECEKFQIKLEEIQLKYEDSLINILRELNYYQEKRDELIIEVERLDKELKEKHI